MKKIIVLTIVGMMASMSLAAAPFDAAAFYSFEDYHYMDPNTTSNITDGDTMYHIADDSGNGHTVKVWTRGANSNYETAADLTEGETYGAGQDYGMRYYYNYFYNSGIGRDGYPGGCDNNVALQGLATNLPTDPCNPDYPFAPEDAIEHGWDGNFSFAAFVKPANINLDYVGKPTMIVSNRSRAISEKQAADLGTGGGTVSDWAMYEITIASDGKLNFQYFVMSGTRTRNCGGITTNSVLANDQLNHIAIRHTSDGTTADLDMFIDGVEVAVTLNGTLRVDGLFRSDGYTGGDPNIQADIELGPKYPTILGGGAWSNQDGYRGDMDNVGFFDDALTDTEIEMLAAGYIPEPATIALLLMGVPVLLRRRR